MTWGPVDVIEDPVAEGVEAVPAVDLIVAGSATQAVVAVERVETSFPPAPKITSYSRFDPVRSRRAGSRSTTPC